MTYKHYYSQYTYAPAWGVIVDELIYLCKSASSRSTLTQRLPWKVDSYETLSVVKLPSPEWNVGMSGAFLSFYHSKTLTKWKLTYTSRGYMLMYTSQLRYCSTIYSIQSTASTLMRNVYSVRIFPRTARFVSCSLALAWTFACCYAMYLLCKFQWPFCIKKSIIPWSIFLTLCSDLFRFLRFVQYRLIDRYCVTSYSSFIFPHCLNK